MWNLDFWKKKDMQEEEGHFKEEKETNWKRKWEQKRVMDSEYDQSTLYTCKKYPGEIYQNVQNRKKLNFIH
jgi:hypothetical protein